MDDDLRWCINYKECYSHFIYFLLRNLLSAQNINYPSSRQKFFVYLPRVASFISFYKEEESKWPIIMKFQAGKYNNIQFLYPIIRSIMLKQRFCF